MVGLIDGDFLLPFSHGWVRECVYREMKSGPPVLDTVYYHPPKTQEDLGPKNREARRKRKNKHDQEKYFEDFPSDILSVINFSYVKRELGLNNEAYEKITAMDGGPDNRGEVRRSARKVASYKEIAEHEGLLESEHSSAESSDEAVEEVTDFDFGLPLTLQLQSRVTPLREEHRRRRKYPDRKRCVTPPRASDIPWTQMDDDPLGLWTELHEECLREREKAPPTPPPVRAVRLYQPRTVERLGEKLTKVKEGLADPLERIVAANKDLVGSENLCSHDLAIKKYKHLPSISHRNQVSLRTALNLVDISDISLSPDAAGHDGGQEGATSDVQQKLRLSAGLGRLQAGPAGRQPGVRQGETAHAVDQREEARGGAGDAH